MVMQHYIVEQSYIGQQVSYLYFFLRQNFAQWKHFWREVWSVKKVTDSLSVFFRVTVLILCYFFIRKFENNMAMSCVCV